MLLTGKPLNMFWTNNILVMIELIQHWSTKLNSEVSQVQSSEGVLSEQPFDIQILIKRLC